MKSWPPILAAIVVGFVVLLSGCAGGAGASSQEREDANHYYRDQVVEVVVTMKDGRDVTCLIYRGEGLDCDFVGATEGGDSSLP